MMKNFTEQEYQEHGEILFNIGKSDAFKSVLKTEVVWSVRMPQKDWNLDTVIIGDGTLKNICLVKTVLSDAKDSKGNFIKEYIFTEAKDGTVREVWLAADRAYKKAVKLYDDWHYFLEIVELRNNNICTFYGS